MAEFRMRPSRRMLYDAVDGDLAGRFDGAALHTHESKFGSGGEYVVDRGERSGEPEVIGIQKTDEFAGGGAEAGVSRGAGIAPLRRYDVNAFVVTETRTDCVEGSVRRTIVRNDNLHEFSAVLLEDRRDRAKHEVAPVVRGNDDGQAKSASR
ncbi:MAG TPA: hypothetical protein VH082_11820 [Rudaea sp.]|nr:hypothetical protein [Rudaea sp.]